MYVLAARDPQRYPLPWGGDPPADEPSLPDYLPYLGDADLDHLHAAMVARHRLLGRAASVPLAALAYSVLIDEGAMRRILDLELPAGDRAEAISDLRAAIEGLEAIEAVHERLHGQKPMLADITGSLESLLAAAADDSEAATGTRDAVQVMTVHQAKGLEFEVVFCAGFAHGLFPVQARPHPLLDADDRAWLEAFKVGFMPSWPSDPDGHLAEEARLAFVAMTRARGRLYVSYADSYLRQAGPSVFLEMAAPEAETRELTRASARVQPSDVLLHREAEVLIASHRSGLSARRAAARLGPGPRGVLPRGARVGRAIRALRRGAQPDLGRHRPLQPDHAQRLPEVPPALLVQPSPGAHRRAALRGHGTGRVPARGARGLPHAGKRVAPSGIRRAAGVARGGAAETPRRLPVADGGRPRPEAGGEAGPLAARATTSSSSRGCR